MTDKNPNFRVAFGGKITNRNNIVMVTVHIENMPLEDAAKIQRLILPVLNAAYPPSDPADHDPAL